MRLKAVFAASSGGYLEQKQKEKTLAAQKKTTRRKKGEVPFWERNFSGARVQSALEEMKIALDAFEETYENLPNLRGRRTLHITQDQIRAVENYQRTLDIEQLKEDLGRKTPTAALGLAQKIQEKISSGETAKVVRR